MLDSQLKSEHYTRFLYFLLCKELTVVSNLKSILEPYLEFLSLKAEKLAGGTSKLLPSIQLHSYLGRNNVASFAKAERLTRKSLVEKWTRRTPNIIPTAAKPNVSTLEKSSEILGQVALACVVPSSPTDVSRYLSIDLVEANSILAVLKRKGIVREEFDRFSLAITADSPPSGTPSVLSDFRNAARFGWVSTKANSSDLDQETKQYAKIVDDVKQSNKKEVRNVLVLDLLRGPGAYPNINEIREGQLRFLFENIDGNPIDEACLFSTISEPKTNPLIREKSCPTRISRALGELWSTIKSFGLINQDYRTTPSGERVLSLLNGTPLAPFSYMETLEKYLDAEIPAVADAQYRTEFLKVIHAGVLYSALSRDCGQDIATELMSRHDAVEFFLASTRNSDFYNPQVMARRFEIDLTAARNALSKSFLYGAAGITTASHPDLYKITKKVAK
jgi:hypothetical protein